MKNIKRLVSSVLVVIMLMTTMITALPVTSNAATGISERINALRSKFPHGKYWNHYTNSSHGGGPNGWCSNSNCNNPNGYTSQPCATHSYNVGSGNYDCNYFDGGIQCFGFANKVFYDIFGVYASGMGQRTDVSNVAVGDLVRLNGDSHSAVVIGRSGNTLTVVECNLDLKGAAYNCYINWDATYYVSNITYFKRASNYDTINKTYSVSYNANGGSGAPSSQTKAYGITLKLSSTKPTRSGYTFTGWNTKADGSGTSYAAGASYTGNAAVTLYAQWKANTYTVSYNANGGSGAPASQTKTHGATLTLSSTKPTRSGYTFTGWNTKADGSGTSYAAGASYTGNAAVTLYAQWKAVHTHSYTAKTTEPTCTEDGSIDYICSCGESYSDVIPSLGHSWGEWVTTDATCTEDGANSRSCSRCGTTETKTISPLGHTPGETVETKAPTCTAKGTKTTYCSVCGEVVSEESIPVIGHDWSDWVQVSAPTAIEDGEKLRYCKTCKTSETESIPALGEPEVPVDPNAPAVVSLDNYTITLDKINDIKEIRFAIGHYTKGSDIKAAEKNVTLDASTVKKYTADGMLTYDLPWMGEYTFWVRYNDGSQYFVYTNVDDITPYAESYGVKLTVKDYAENYKDMWLAEGTFDTYNEIKASAAFKYQASANKLDLYAKTTHDFSYTMTNPGPYTVLIRYNDGTIDVIHHELTVEYPEFSANGLQVTVTNIPDIKIIRTAPGHHTSVADIKKAAGVRNFNNKIIKDAESYMVQYRDAGEVTLIVEYNNGYKHFYYHNIEPKTATMIQNKNTVMFDDLDGFVMIRYAEGVYTTSSQIKAAKGSKVLKPADISGGYAIISGLETGATYTFCVQFDDDSYDYYVVTITDVEPEPETYNVSFDVNGGVATYEDKTLCYGDAYGELPVPSRTGYTFKGWYTEREGGTHVTSDTVMELTEDHTLYAHWEVLAYTASWSTGTGYTIQVNRTASPEAGANIGVIKSGDTVYYGDKLTVKYTKADYYHITSNGDTSITVTGNVTGSRIYATAALNPVSGWVKASALPTGAQVTSEKWTYNLTSYIKKSTSASISGYTQYNSYEEVTNSGSFKYASFPGNYNMNDWYAQNWNRSPYTSYNNGSTRRVVSNKLTGYIYWHWVYPLSGNHTEGNRAIGEYYNEYIPGAGNTTIWEVFDSTTNAPWEGSAFRFAGHSSYSYWWFRVDYYTCNYTDYTKYYDHKKVEEKTSTTAVTAGGDISNVVKWVQYREK